MYPRKKTTQDLQAFSECAALEAGGVFCYHGNLYKLGKRVPGVNELKTEIIINANAQQIWQVLTAFSDYPNWNQFFTHISGELKIDDKLTVTISPPGSKSMNFTPKVIVLNEAKELRWRGEFISRFLFQGEHYFLLEQLKENETRLIHGEYFAGLLTPVFEWLGLLKKTTQGFEQFNQAIKQQAESLKAEVANSL